ncbi:aminotransferase class V-fold PLP-dependent enzyme [bacterium]|nr:MAG: aminotransferase class V-fold PLP-dependent enzyme [bacterium]
MLSPIPSDFEQFKQWRLENFPFFESKICLTHASVSPLPKRAGDAIAEYAGQIVREGQFDYLHMATYLRCKERIATMLGYGAVPEEIAFASSTSHALGLVATCFPWNECDNCVVADGDFPANVLVWKNLTLTRGVELKLVPHRPAMDLTWDDIEPLLDEKTRLVSLSAVNFLSGASLNLEKIGGELHARGIKFCVDGIQALGAVQLNLQHVDFVCADAHKWLLGPNGAAFMWARNEVLQTMRPQILGWLATEHRMSWFAYDTVPFPTAERFEPGARNYLGVIGMEASLGVIQEMGADVVEQRIITLRDYGASAIEAAGAELLFKPGPEHKSGIFSFRMPGRDIVELNTKLDERFALSLRQDRNDDYWIRVSAHFMNCENDLDELAAALA